MALKSYHKETLNDNWYEERASPLNGVLPYDGETLLVAQNEYTTTTGIDFNGARSTPQRRKPRMIGEHNLDQAMSLTAAAADKGFRSALPQPDAEAQRRYLDSTYRTSYVNHFASSSSSASPHRVGASALSLVPAGGVGGRNIERGKAVSGAMGEVFRTSAEPQRDTHAQRSWLYSTDPTIVAIHAKAAREQQERAEAPERSDSTDGSSSSSAPTHFRRQSTSITTIPLSHRGVFADD